MDEWNWDEGDCPEYNNASEGYSYRSEYQLGGLRPFVANQNSTFNRDLIAFNIYRDGEFLAQVDANTYMYDDDDYLGQLKRKGLRIIKITLAGADLPVAEAHVCCRSR